jgi:hypothetical protein
MLNPATGIYRTILDIVEGRDVGTLFAAAGSGPAAPAKTEEV